MQENEWDLPPPRGVSAVRGSSALTWIVLLVAFVVLLFVALWVPVPIFYGFLPGPVREVESLVEIDDAKTYSSEGAFYLTTASIDPEVTFAEIVLAAFDDELDIVYAESVAPGGDFEELRRQSNAQMEMSKNDATRVALHELGSIDTECDDPEITAVFEDTPADGVLEVGDIVREVDGTPVRGSAPVSARITDRDVGDRVTLTVERGGATRTFDVRTIEDPRRPGQPIVGIQMQEVDADFDPDFDVEIRSGEIGGPSAGLMFALGVYDRLTPDDLTHGEKVAGTGTIACDGTVGAIGEVNLKVAGAEAEGADVFLVPAGNAAEAERAAEQIEVVKVSDFEDALAYLERLE